VSRRTWRPALAGLCGLLAAGALIGAPVHPVAAEATGSFMPSWPYPSQEPAASPGPGSSTVPFQEPGAVAALLALIPADLRDRCLPELPETGPRAGELARVVCLEDAGAASDATELTWALFDTSAQLEGAFDEADAWASVFGTMGPGFDCEGGAYLGPWPVDGPELGRALCFGVDGDARITWTRTTDRTLATIRVPGGDHARASQVWQQVRSGP
jgi:hypothetical protein